MTVRFDISLKQPFLYHLGMNETDSNPMREPQHRSVVGRPWWMLSIASAVLPWISQPPLAWFPVVMVAVIPFLAAAKYETISRKQYAVLYSAAVFYWALTLQGLRLANPLIYPCWLALAAYLAIYPIMFVVVLRRLSKLGVAMIFAAPLAWVGMECIRNYMLTGISAAMLGHTLAGVPTAIQIADLGGTYAVSLMIVVINVGLYNEWSHRRLQKQQKSRDPELPYSMTTTVTVVVLWTATYFYGTYRLGQQTATGETTIALIGRSEAVEYEQDPSRELELFDAYAKKEGRNALPSALVNAIADAETPGPKTRAMLEGWAEANDFYWRSQALRGIANRARPEDRDRFRTAAQDDPSFLFRLSGAKGLLALGLEGDRALLHQMVRKDPDIRLRVKLAADLLAAGDTVGFPLLLATLSENRSFLGDPWGLRLATEAKDALEIWIDEKLDIDFSDPTSIDAARRRVTDYAAAKDLIVPARAPTPAEIPDTIGGVEVRSCRYGDLFVGWDEDGRLYLGLEQTLGPKLPADEWPKLRGFLKQERPVATHGIVVCDFLRIFDEAAGTHVKCAPAALPEDLFAGLRRIAEVLEESGSTELSKALRLRLSQFESE